MNQDSDNSDPLPESPALNLKDRVGPLQDSPAKRFIGFLKSLLKRRSIGNSTDLAEGLHDLMDEGQARGFITDEESHMVYGVLDLKETQAHSIMIPRTELSSAPLDSTLEEIIHLVRSCGHTRIPIHANNLDDIVGILHAKDLLRYWGEDPSGPLPAEILRKPYFVPETKPVNELLTEMKARKTHMAVVTDEYGGTSGIITIEDILEEIVGEIQDEHDQEETRITAVDERSWLVDARLHVEDLEDRLGVRLPSGDFESVGGLLIHLCGAIPKTNQKITLGELEFVVQRSDQRRIHSVLIKLNPSAQPPNHDHTEA